jgi:riboflavin-specific deaminase-like protein
MVATLDGGVTGPDGRSRSISSDTDRVILGELRRLSDAILVGASTVRLEPYGPVRVREDAAEARESLGLAAAPRLVIVSGSLDLPWTAPMFADSTLRPLVVTTEASDGDARRVAQEHAELLILEGDRLNPKTLIERLVAMGLHRLVCEGGPGLLGALAGAGVVDEVDLALSPHLAGGTRPAGGAPLTDPEVFALEHVITDGSFLFTRYVARRSASDTPSVRVTA